MKINELEMSITKYKKQYAMKKANYKVIYGA